MGKLRDKILNAKDIKSESVEVPEWGVTLEVRGLTGAARNRVLDQAIKDDKGNMDLNILYPELLISSVYDPEDGEKVFTAKDRDALNAKASSAVERLAKVASRLSGIDQEAESDKAKN